MPKITMTFDLPDERDDLKLAQRGSDYYCFLFELDNELRSFLKHGYDKKKFNTPDDVMEYIRQKINEEIEIHDIE